MCLTPSNIDISHANEHHDLSHTSPTSAKIHRSLMSTYHIEALLGRRVARDFIVRKPPYSSVILSISVRDLALNNRSEESSPHQPKSLATTRIFNASCPFPRNELGHCPLDISIPKTSHISAAEHSDCPYDQETPLFLETF